MLNLLLVDDNDAMRGLNKRLLQNLGCKVTETNSTRDALQMLEHENPFDVMLVDFRMPYMNGIELLEQIKARHPDAVIILTSASPNPPQEALARSKGAAYTIFGYASRDCFREALQDVTHVSL
jgi:CheY-like chemotaxis protein